MKHPPDLLNFLQLTRTTIRQLEILTKAQIPDTYKEPIKGAIHELKETLNKFNDGGETDEKRTLCPMS